MCLQKTSSRSTSHRINNVPVELSVVRSPTKTRQITLSPSLSPENFFRDGLESVLKKTGRTDVRFHAFRRFREATLQKSDARQLLIDYWMGHENDEMSTRYGKQLLEDVKYRKEWAEKVGLGFDLPTSNPGLFGLRGLQNEENQVAA